ncbi:MAG TPA: MBL fold metallo-hydrolase [Candidatus Bathyarchaeia archaeon]|nr:MBL fold metallo-hydrolase [Candidatus Bathyarchaeia archaeon]
MNKISYSFSYHNGLQFNFSNNKKLLIDGSTTKISPKTTSIVSHAHSDHFSVMNSNIPTYATQETIDLYLCQKTGNTRGIFHPMRFNEKFELETDFDDLEVTLVSSGHILGSASILLELAGKKILFSSDIGGKGLLTIKEPLAKPEVDTLIVEATFGSPEISFQPREEISMDILKWAANAIKEKRNVVISAGRIGSAQELIKLFNDFTNLRVITHGDVSPPSEVYKKHDINLEFKDSKSDEGREIVKSGEAVIIQSRERKIVPYFLSEHIKYRSAIVTGMASRFSYKDFDASFPLSSHASFDELLDYISKVTPKKVFTLYGFEKKLAKAISNELQIPAIPLKDKSLEEGLENLVEIPHLKKTQNINLLTEKPLLPEEQQKKPSLQKDKTLDDFFRKR